MWGLHTNDLIDAIKIFDNPQAFIDLFSNYGTIDSIVEEIEQANLFHTIAQQNLHSIALLSSLKVNLCHVPIRISANYG